MLGQIFSLKRFVYYGFPVYLSAVEYAIRFLMSFAPGKSEEISFAAAANGIAAAGLSLIAPVLIPKPAKGGLSDEQINRLAAQGARLANIRDQRLIAAAWLGLLFLPFLWGLALWLSHNDSHMLDARIWNAAIPGPFVIALAMYGVGIIYTELKEVT